MQIDEVEVYTYENQRWNVLTGFSSKGGKKFVLLL